MNYKEYKEKLKNEYNKYKEKQKIKLDKFKRKQAENLEKFKIKNNKTKKNKIIKGGVFVIDIYTINNSINPIIKKIHHTLTHILMREGKILETISNQELLNLIKIHIYSSRFINSLPIYNKLLEILKNYDTDKAEAINGLINMYIQELDKSDEFKTKLYEYLVIIFSNIPKYLPQQNRFIKNEFVSEQIKYKCSRV